MDEIFDQIAETKPLLIVLSAPQKKDPLLPGKISLRKKEVKGTLSYFAEELTEKKAFHKTLSPEEVPQYIKEKMALLSFRQIGLFDEEKEISFRISKKGKIAKSVNTKNKTKTLTEKHNREKQYLIRPGDKVPFLVDLGVFTKDYQPVASKYDKFRQINRFIEIVDHAFSDYDKDEISILDFGCGKSYLTFFLYHYFAVLKKKRVSIIGYDLKKRRGGKLQRAFQKIRLSRTEICSGRRNERYPYRRKDRLCHLPSCLRYCYRFCPKLCS